MRLLKGLVENAALRPQRRVPACPASSVFQRPAIGVSRSSLKTVLVGTVLRTLTPGAARSTLTAPKFEKPASASLESVAATQILFAASGAVAGLQGVCGEVSLLTPSLPAATTYSVFGLLLMALSSVAEVPAKPMLALATFAFIVPA